MLKRTLYFLVAMLMANSSFAEMMTFEKEVEEIVANDQSREQVEAFALQKVKRLAVEEAGTYISSMTVVSNAMMQKDEITALASGVVQAKIVGLPNVRLENGVIHVNVKARIQVDTAILDKQVAELLKEKGTVKKLEDEQKKVRELENRLANLKSTELKRLEELNVQAIAMEQERERRRLANAEMALQAQGELKKAEAERLKKDRELQERTARLMTEQEKQRKAEAEALAKEQDRIRRAQLENEQRWNDLVRKSQLAQQQWATIDDSISLKQAMEETKSIRVEIATLKERSEMQHQESITTLKAAYEQQRAVTTPKLPPALSEKDPFESDTEFTLRRKAYDKQVDVANKINRSLLERMRDEETLKIAQTRLDYFKQQVRVLKPFIERLRALQERQFVMQNEPVEVELGAPDANRSCFPVTIINKEHRWTVDWTYTDRNKARDIYQTRTFLKAESLVQIDGSAREGYILAAVNISHPGTGQRQTLSLVKPAVFSEIKNFDSITAGDLVTAENDVKQAESFISRNACLRQGNHDKNGFRFCGGIALDLRTGLMWPKDCDFAKNKNMTVDEAEEWTKTLNIDGYTDWRLPTIDELYVFLNNSLNGKGFCGWERPCVSSTRSTYNSQNSWRAYIEYYRTPATVYVNEVKAWGRERYEWVIPMRFYKSPDDITLDTEASIMPAGKNEETQKTTGKSNDQQKRLKKKARK